MPRSRPNVSSCDAQPTWTTTAGRETPTVWELEQRAGSYHARHGRVALIPRARTNRPVAGWVSIEPDGTEQRHMYATEAERWLVRMAGEDPDSYKY